jgi:hypothetical protein
MVAVSVGPLLINATTTGYGPIKTPIGKDRSYSIVAVAGAGANASASISIEVSNDNLNWVELGSITFSDVNETPITNGLTSNTSWLSVRANITNISGSGMTINGKYGVL